MIVISKPYIEKNGDLSRLCSEILIDGKASTIWYEVEKEYEAFLCYEKADAFLVGLLPLAMAFKHNIEIKGAPISEKLYWNLTNTYIPALANYSGYYHKIDLSCDIDAAEYAPYAVGTGFSGGVDSFYTLLKNTNSKTKSFAITHVTFFNVGANGSFGGEAAEKRFYNRTSSFENFVKEQGLKFVKVNSNISDIVMMSYNFTHSFRSMSAVLALQKLFKTYYYSADFTLKEFSFDPYDSSYYDLLNSGCFSTENTSFFTTGAVETRCEKMKFISQYPITYNVLNVCNSNDSNCRTCAKCIRTMCGLYSINKLDLYSPVFDVDYFKSKLSDNFAQIIAKAYDGTVESKYSKDIMQKAKENGVSIPIFSYIKAFPLTIKNKTIATLSKNKTLKKMWHKHINKNTGIRFNDI